MLDKLRLDSAAYEKDMNEALLDGSVIAQQIPQDQLAGFREAAKASGFNVLVFTTRAGVMFPIVHAEELDRTIKAIPLFEGNVAVQIGRPANVSDHTPFWKALDAIRGKQAAPATA